MGKQVQPTIWRGKTDKGRQPVCHRVVTDGGECSEDGKRSAECGMVPPWAGLARQVVQDSSSGSLGAKIRMLEMNHQLASRGDYILNIDQSGLVKVLYGSILSLSERAKRPGWLWGKQAGPGITREATIHRSSHLRDWTE